MRATLILLAALALPGGALADGEPCGFAYTRVEPVEGIHAYAEMEERDCPEGRSLMIAATAAGQGRVSLEWYEDERGRGFDVFYPPYFVSWTDTQRGCSVVVFVHGEGEVAFPCVAGSPPPPTTLP